jgi:hypothetical protein
MDKPKLGNLIAAKDVLNQLADSKLRGTAAYLVARTWRWSTRSCRTSILAEEPFCFVTISRRASR